MAEHWFCSAEKQASRMVAQMQREGVIDSVRSLANFQERLEVIAQNFKENNLPSINNLTPELATQYLVDRATQVKQSTLNMERQAMQHVIGEKLPIIKSELQTIKSCRSYTPTQVQIVAQHQTEKHALATEIAHSAGLRAHELLTIRPTTERAADAREAHSGKFEGREGQSYTVTGKGGLTREVRIPDALSERLEAHRLPEHQQITDRGVHYQQHYEIGGGQRWSNSFSAASNRSCNWSNGAHGLRHSYAQERMSELQREYPRDEALRIVSQEMGHFRPEITEVYLR